jgi:hypothetical protein
MCSWFILEMKLIVFVHLDRLFSLIESHLVINLEERFELPGGEHDLKSTIHLLGRELKLEQILFLLKGKAARELSRCQLVEGGRVLGEVDLSYFHCY